MTIASSPQLALHRQQFPALANKAYFNYGGQGPMPQAAIDAILQAHNQAQQQGPFSGQVNAWMMREADRARSAIAAELQVDPSTITLTEDVSVGCNIGLWGIDWQAGDHLLVSDCEHPGIIAAIQEIQRRFAIEVSVCPLRETLNEGDPVAIVTQHLRPNTRLFVVSHILWNTGQVLPLAEMVAACQQFASRQPIRVLVDAAQSIGVLPLNLAELNVDFYAFTGHKWWGGAAGVGGLYVRPETRESLSPTFIGWRGIVYDDRGQPSAWRPDGRRYEIATSDFTLYGALCAAIAVQNEWGTQADRFDRIRSLSKQLWQQLCEVPQIRCLRAAPPEAGLISFQVTTGQAHAAIVQALEQQQIFVRTILDPDCIRACVHYLTLESEIDRLAAAIANVIR
ncbi:aminotransferase class V-fold PLP-dependent enzyme [Microcoleus sp. FACHB-1515]|uniref:aminotransferase class V-fold PLP-dependent enzyme n=1 Tax=Cyanophyceae TaxID=3028117 RepID=UPI001685D899|nr:aminotransferase class V-fold PLP-dependent enzyme [Microcoleus sp. FACHB-1515]MBD2089313.1 aminotransferase class V-fold PLP-dependent enzyme [Microcoleus sp. FACHB-1515]